MGQTSAWFVIPSYRDEDTLLRAVTALGSIHPWEGACSGAKPPATSTRAAR